MYKVQALTDRQTDRQTDRHSGIELLKIIAIFLIVISHVTQTLGSKSFDVSYQDYVILLGNATLDIQEIILMLLRQTGALGNTIFFACSAWFLVGKTNSTSKKAFSLLSTVWSISILILCFYLAFYPSCLTVKVLIKQFFPTTFANNWYMTCYIIFLFIYPWLNKMIALTNQKQLLKIVLFSSSLWIVANYIIDSLFFVSALILWITIYFLVAYLKLYCGRLMVNIKFGIMLLLIGILGYIAQVLVTNYVGLYLISAFSDKVLRWNNNHCPFYLMIALGSIIIALQATYRSKIINYISGLSMFVYLFHENYLFRCYTRPAIWQYLYINYGYAHVIMLDIAFAVVLFFLSLVVSAIYKETLYRFVVKVSNNLYLILTKIYDHIEHLIMKFS